MREIKVNGITWISVVRPTVTDIQTLKERFPQIHPLILEELETPTIRPRVENYEHHIYMVLHFPNFVEEHNKTIAHEMDFVLMLDTFITVQYEDIGIVEDFWKECETNTTPHHQYGKSPIHPLYYLLRKFYAHSLKELDQFQEKIDLIEDRVFSGHEKEILEDVALLKRNILDFRRAIKPQGLTLESLVLQGTELFGEKTRPFLTDLSGEHLKVWSLLENHKETLDAIYDTNNSLLVTKTNEIMRVFTILAFISFIPTAVANIYGMNISDIPLTGNPNAFWIILIVMSVFTLAVYLALKWRKLV